MVVVPKCANGFERVDCGLCAKICPKETIRDSEGLFCKKPEIKMKNIYNNETDCE